MFHGVTRPPSGTTIWEVLLQGRGRHPVEETHFGSGDQRWGWEYTVGWQVNWEFRFWRSSFTTTDQYKVHMTTEAALIRLVSSHSIIPSLSNKTPRYCNWVCFGEVQLSPVINLICCQQCRTNWDQSYSLSSVPHNPIALLTERLEGHSLTCSPSPQNTRIPTHPQRPCKGSRAGPLISGQKENHTDPHGSEIQLPDPLT